MRLAARAPREVAGLCLIAPAGRYGGRSWSCPPRLCPPCLCPPRLCHRFPSPSSGTYMDTCWTLSAASRWDQTCVMRQLWQG